MRPGSNPLFNCLDFKFCTVLNSELLLVSTIRIRMIISNSNWITKTFNGFIYMNFANLNYLLTLRLQYYCTSMKFLSTGTWVDKRKHTVLLSIFYIWKQKNTTNLWFMETLVVSSITSENKTHYMFSVRIGT